MFKVSIWGKPSQCGIVEIFGVTALGPNSAPVLMTYQHFISVKTFYIN